VSHEEEAEEVLGIVSDVLMEKELSNTPLRNGNKALEIQ
jgi:hypothetical protein